jgi:hypothetical protein
MKKSLFLILTSFVICVCAAAHPSYNVVVEEGKQPVSMTLPQVIEYAKQLPFKKECKDVSEALIFFDGMNALNAKDVDYIEWCFQQNRCSIEVLYGLYVVLNDFFDQESNSFKPQDLNGGLTRHNYNFLRAVFKILPSE